MTRWSVRRAPSVQEDAAPGTSTRSTARTTSCPAPYWCSAIGLVDGAEPVAGAVYYPGPNELWVGGPGRSTTLDGARVPELLDQPLAAVSIATYLHPRYVQDRQRVASWLAAVSSPPYGCWDRHRSTSRGGERATRDIPAGEPQPLGLVPGSSPGDRRRWGRRDTADRRHQIAGNRQSVAETKAALEA